MQHCNVLILSAGRRVELVKCFKKASSKLGLDSLLVAGDCQENAPALYFADDRVILPRISSPKYIDSIIDVCNRYEISLVVPTIDTDLLVLAINKERIEGPHLPKCLYPTKRLFKFAVINKTQRFLKQSGFVVPHMYSAES